jgi:Large ribosomal RNA subunit accumulation protein YceD
MILKNESMEWSHMLDADEVTSKPLNLVIHPNETQKKALCKRLGLHAIEDLQADLELRRNAGNMIIHIRGKLEGVIKQKCVVTLAPVREQVAEEFEGWFADVNQAVSFTKAKRERLSLQEKNEQPILEEFDDPEAIVDGQIDLGEFVTQHFSLSLNPYPRAEGVEFEKAKDVTENEAEGIYHNPFAALKDWKMKEQKKDN